MRLSRSKIHWQMWFELIRKKPPLQANKSWGTDLGLRGGGGEGGGGGKLSEIIKK